MGMPDPSRPGGIVKRQRPRSLAPFRIAGRRGVPLANAAADTDHVDYCKR